MKFPKRAPEHIVESRSMTLLRLHLPEEWVVREVTERDYGIDVYVEIVNDDLAMSGDLVLFQVKGRSEAEESPSGFVVSGIKRETLNYWLRLPVPVFLVLACTERKTVNWANINELHRQGHFGGDSHSVSVAVTQRDDFSQVGLLAFKISYIRERRWAEIQNAIEKSLMLFNTLGPLVLICRRQPDILPCTTTIQYLMNQHYEHYVLLSRYLLMRQPKYLREWYEANASYAVEKGLELSLTMYYGTLKAMIKEFLGDYRDCIIAAYELVTERQAAYFAKEFPSLYLHLNARPHTFLAADWYARFLFDEYEDETRNPESLYFADFDVFDNVLDDLTRT